MFRNVDGRRFEDASRAMGPDFLRIGYQRGSAFVDFNNDGFLDIATTSLDQRQPRVDERGLRLLSDRRVHFGLGGESTADVEVRWPGGKLEVRRNVSACEAPPQTAWRGCCGAASQAAAAALVPPLALVGDQAVKTDGASTRRPWCSIASGGTSAAAAGTSACATVETRSGHYDPSCFLIPARRVREVRAP
jgi:hypothetical protein